MSDRDYYEILGLTPAAEGAMVDQAYWHLARKYQGLAATNPRAQYMLDELNEAYAVLGNPKLREQYDAFRDDVLIRKGMLKPVKSKQHHAEARPAGKKAPSGGFALPKLHIPYGRTYALSAIIAALAFAGAWAGVNVLFVATTLGIGLALSLTPAVTSRLQDVQLSMPTMPSMPAMPQVSMPQIQTPKLGIPALPEVQMPQIPQIASMTAPGRDEPIDADELRASTAATIARWRASVGLHASPVEPIAAAPADPSARAERDKAPSTELVDIVRSERELEEDSEPLNAVLEILRGSHRSEAPR